MVVAEWAVVQQVLIKMVERRVGTQPLEVTLDEATRCVANTSLDRAPFIHAVAIRAFALPERVARKPTPNG